MTGLCEIKAALQRLQGHLVATPLIGDILLPGLQLPADLRLKAECLQTGGSLHYRGVLHYLLRQMGRYKGLVLGGSWRQVIAAARAGHSQRLPMLAALAAEPTAGQAQLLQFCGCSYQVGASLAELRAQSGFQLMPGLEDDDMAAGVATLGLELAGELPLHCEVVMVSPPALAPPLQAGLLAGGCQLRVQGVAEIENPVDSTALQMLLQQYLNLQVNETSLPGLCAIVGSDHQCCCVVLAN